MKKNIIIIFIFLCLLSAKSYAQEKKVALVLAGGGSWGLAHVGVIKVIEELNIPIDYVIGTSMGAIVGGLYASGYGVEELNYVALHSDWKSLFLERFTKKTYTYSEDRIQDHYFFDAEFDYSGFDFTGGLIDDAAIMRFLDILTLHIPSWISFDALPRKFRSVATNLVTGKKEVFSEGRLAHALRASMSIPGAFPPWQEHDNYYVDGFVVENLPISPALEFNPDIIIAVDLTNKAPFNPETIKTNPLAPVTRSYEILISNTENPLLEKATLIISVDVGDLLQTDYHKGKEFISLGEKSARNELESLKHIADLTQDRAPLNIPAPYIENTAEIRSSGLKEKEAIRFNTDMIKALKTNEHRLDLVSAFTRIESNQQFDRIRISQETEDSQTIYNFDFIKKKKKNRFRLGFEYETTIASAITSDIDILPSVVLSNIGPFASDIYISGELLDAPSISLVLHQSLFYQWAFETFITYIRDFETSLTTTSIGYQYKTALFSTGIEFLWDIGSDALFKTGLVYENATAEYQSEIPAGSKVKHAFFFKNSFGFNNLDHTIFPALGIQMLFSHASSIPILPSSRYFHILETQGRIVLPIATPASLSILWKAGTDKSLEQTHEAPVFYKPSLQDRHLFPSPLLEKEHKGSIVGGLGIEAKIHLHSLFPSILLPCYGLCQTSVGITTQKIQDFVEYSQRIHTSIALGLGIRFTDAFGFALRLGTKISTLEPVQPFIALDLGSFAF